MHASFASRVAVAVVLAIVPAWADAQAVGRTPGHAGVSPSGSSTYTIPLWTPPGAGGLRPNLALVYSQDVDNGLLGVGWSISGLSRITRCFKTIAQDGIDDAPTLETGDAYCLDGQRLRLASGTYGAAGSVYRTEIESFKRITAMGAAGNGPEWWEVRTKDGLILQYGHSTDSRIESVGSTTARVWAISSMRDRAGGTAAGNTATFTYHEDTANGSYRPNEINYAANASQILAAPYQVKFVYETATRTDPIYGYFAGSPLVDGRVNEFYRLDQIEIRHQGSVVKIYDLTYETAGGAGGRARLASVKECSTSLSVCLLPTNFTWTTSAAGLQPETDSGISALANVRYADVNADGLDDIVYTSGSTWRWRLATGSGFGAEINTGVADTNASMARIIEWDGDGRWDLLVPSAGNVWQVYVSTGAGYAGAFNTGYSTSVANSHFTTADMTGDGRDDLIRLEDDPAFGLRVWARARDASNFAASETLVWSLAAGVENLNFYIQSDVAPVFGPSYRNRSTTRRLDFDGDGREDLFVAVRVIDGEGSRTDTWRAVLASGSGTASAFGRFLIYTNPSNPLWQAPLIGDFNGDGLTDAAWSSALSGSTWRVQMSQGRGLSSLIVGPSTGNSFAINSALVLDYDRDGKDDILVAELASTVTWWLFRGTGTGLAAGVNTGIPLSGSGFGVADVNGDASTDMLYVAGTARYRLGHPTPSDHLASATDGFGVTASFTYAPLTDSTVYTKGSGAIYPVVDIRPPSQVVKTLTQTDGSGNGTTFNVGYTYAGGRADFNGRGFLGFETRTSVDGSGNYNLRTIETYKQNFPYVGALLSVELQQFGGTRVRRTTNNWTAETYGSGFSARYFPYVTTSSTDEHELGGVQNGVRYRAVATSVAGFDATSGLITDVTTTTTEIATGINAASSKSERLWITSVSNDTTNWCLGRPAAVSQIASHTLPGGASITRTSDATWDGLYCRPTQQRVEPGSPLWQVTVALGYDGFGNANSQTVTGIGMAPRATTLSYGSRGQFPESVTRQVSATFSETSTQTWNYGLAVPESATDPNTLTTGWQHDSFGRMTSETRQDQTSTTFDRVACLTGCASNVRWYVQIRPRSTSGTVLRTDTQYFDQYDRQTHDYRVLPTGATRIAGHRLRDARGRVYHEYVPYMSGGAYEGWSTAAYDALDRATAIALYNSSGGFDRQSTSAYEGLSAVTTDPRSNATRRYVAAWGDLLRIADAAGGNTNHGFDAFGNLLSVTDAYGNVSASTIYNVRGMRTQLADMNLGTWTFTPNALGEVISQLDAKGQTSTATYDRLGRLTGRSEAEGLTTWTWGSSVQDRNVGRLQSISGTGYSESFTYNPKGQLVNRSISTGTTYQIDYQYNDIGALHAMTYPASVGARYKVKYGYAYGDVASIREFTGDVDGTVLWSLTTLDPLGNPIDESYGNGLRVVSGFNPLTGLLESRQAGVGGSSNNRQSLTFGWDKTNNVTQRQDLLQQSLTENFYYDALNRLDYSTLNGSQNLDVTLDLIGNVTARSDVGSYTYHATKKHAVISAGGSSYGYDPNGNLTSRSNASGSTAVTWTSYNYPASIVFTPAGGSPTNVALNKPATSSGPPCAVSEGPEKAFNGSVSGGWSDKWCSLQSTQWLQVDLQSSQSITQFVVKHAEAGGEESYYNTRDFNLQVSPDGSTWTTAVTVTGSSAAITTHPVSVTARYVRLNIITPTQSGNTAARIYELEVWAGSTGTTLSSQFLYTPDRQYFRQTAAYSNGVSTTEYVGGVMEIVSENGTTQYRHMVPAGNGLVIQTRIGGKSENRYVTRDHVGSISLITNWSGSTEMTQSFAAYGARRQSNWQTGTPDWNVISWSTRRGYTGHTMLDNLNLVHMNGRVFDPAIGRFMSADPVADGLAAPGGFNRYAYVGNNPLSAGDPSGFFSERNSRRPATIGGGDDDLSSLELAQHRGLLRSGMTAGLGSWMTGTNANWGGGSTGTRIGSTYATPAEMAAFFAANNRMVASLRARLRSESSSAIAGSVASGVPGRGMGPVGDAGSVVITASRAGREFSFSQFNSRGTLVSYFSSDLARRYQSVGPSAWSGVEAGGQHALQQAGEATLIAAGLVPFGGGIALAGRELAAARGAAAATGATSGSLRGLGNIGSHGVVDAGTALGSAQKWLGAGYKEIAPGVFRSADGLRQFRMTNADLLPTHGRIGSHVHFEALNDAGKVIENLHLPVGP